MKMFFLLSFAVFSLGASASVTDHGFNCSMTYGRDGDRMAGSVYNAIWVADGARFTDDYLGFHTVTLNTLQKNGETYWQVEVLEKSKSLIKIEVPDYTGFDFTIPVQVTEPGDEDPRTFDYLKLACDSAHFAG